MRPVNLPGFARMKSIHIIKLNYMSACRKAVIERGGSCLWPCGRLFPEGGVAD